MNKNKNIDDDEISQIISSCIIITCIIYLLFRTNIYKFSRSLFLQFLNLFYIKDDNKIGYLNVILLNINIWLISKKLALNNYVKTSRKTKGLRRKNKNY